MEANTSLEVLVTGHAGYIGSILVPVLQSAGHNVTGLDTYFFEEGTFGKELVKVRSIKKDIRDVTLADLKDFDAVVHLAALCNDPLGDLNPQLTFDINHVSSVNLAKLAKEAGVKRFLYASSCSMYGTAGDGMLTEEAPLHPLTPYAISKVRTEEDVSRLADKNFSPVFMRNATAYGVSPRLRADVVLNNLVCWAYTTRKIRILSDGTPWRPIVHVEDIANAFASALVVPREAIHNQAFNVGVKGENYRVRDLANIVQEAIPGCVVEYAENAGPDPRNYRVDFSKLARTLPGFKPKWIARKGVEELNSAFQRVGLTSEDFQRGMFTRLAELKRLLNMGQLDHSLRWRPGGLN